MWDEIHRRILGPPGRAAALTLAILGWTLAPGAGPPPSAAGQDALTVTITPKDIWPPSAVTNLAASSGAEGQILLQWTAPDANGYVFPFTTPAAGYFIHIATFSADSVASTTTWWAGSVNLGAVPAPAQAGASQTFLINGLSPGTTYWASIESFDPAGNISPIDARSSTPGQQAHALAVNLPPTAPTGLHAVAVTSTTVTLAWGASFDSGDLAYYRVHADSTPPHDFSHAFILTTGSATTTLTETGLSSGTVVAYYVTAVDSEAAESPPSNILTVQTVLIKHLCQVPFGIGISSAPGTATLTWMRVRAFQDGTFFADPSNPTPSELASYQVYRATAPIMAPWAPVASVPPSQLTWTDSAAGPQYYYYVSGLNDTGETGPSMIRGDDGTGWVLAYDGVSYLQMSRAVADDLIGSGGNPDTAYYIDTDSRTAPTDVPVFKAIDFRAWRGGLTLEPGKRLASMGSFGLHYAVGASSLTSSGLIPSAVPAVPQNLSVFWFNGIKWVQLYGTLSSLTQFMSLQSPYLGQYQLRTVERVTDFNFDPGGLSTREITPNGDGRNDFAVFTFDNPRDSAVSGRILDLRGGVVADMTQGPISNSLMWDGRSGGRVVPGGVYIYVIQAEGKVFNGTILVVR